jgi:hypothetical protein
MGRVCVYRNILLIAYTSTYFVDYYCFDRVKRVSCKHERSCLIITSSYIKFTSVQLFTVIFSWNLPLQQLKYIL